VRAKKIISGALAAVLIVCLPFFLALTSLLPLITPLFLRIQYARPDVPPSTTFTPEQRLAFAAASAHYLVSGEGIDYLADLETDDGQPLFNQRELTHMVDVKVLLRQAMLLDLALGALVAASLSILLGFSELRGRAPLYLFAASLVAPGLAFASLIIVPLRFQWFFVEFHHVFFEGETWLFPRTDTLIQLFPEQFWFNALQSWLLLVIGVSSAIVIGSYVWIRKRRA
jgi:integral membrane protein (TIGR01906 family)